MNTYQKFCPNVFVAKCEQQHEKGAIITMTTRYGATHEVIVFNLVGNNNGAYYYSVIRADGLDAQEYARRRAEKLNNAAENANKKSSEKWEAANEGRDFLIMGEPIKIGHHSEKKHRALIQRNHDRMNKAVELEKVAETYESRAAYWESKADTINLSMPQSIEFYKFKLEEATKYHADLKNGTIEKSHSFSLPYAKKAVNEAAKNYETAVKLWGE